MKKVVLDTSFILSAIKYKIDFLDDIKFLGLTPLIPKQVLNELKNIIDSKKKLRFKDNAKLALKILNKKSLKKIDIKYKNVDNGIINYAKKNKTAIIATMDKELKSKVPNQKLVIRAMKRLEIV
jgi:rRNA-processing protein FCF1